MKPIYEENKTKSSAGNQFIKFCLGRIKQNKNLNIIVVGESGSGKSYISLVLAEMLDLKFNMSNVCFDSNIFIEHIDELEKGSTIVLEELGVQAYNRNWYSPINKALDQIFQTFRHKNLITICNVPSIDFIDKHLRKQFHVLIVSKGVFSKNKSLVNIYRFSQSYITGDTYLRKLKVKINNYPYDLGAVWFPKPSNKLCVEYEKEMGKWKTELRKGFLKKEKDFLSWDESGIKYKKEKEDLTFDSYLNRSL